MNGPPVARPFSDVDWVTVLRRELTPWLRTYPTVRIWHAGASAAEVYTTAIVLREEGVLARARIYVTADTPEALDEVRKGHVEGPLPAAAEDYRASGGQAALEEYFQADGDGLGVRPLLRERLVFAEHNLAGDASFNEFHLIVCRNLVDGSDELRARAEQVLRDSLCPLGFLALAPGTPLQGAATWLEPLRPEIGLHRRIA